MVRKALLALVASTLALATSSAAFAGTKDDIQSCREALIAQDKLAADDYRMSFKSKKGNKNRTLKIVAKGEDANYLVKCTLNKANEVTALEVSEK